ENERAYEAVEFVARAKYALEPPPLPTAEELAADDSDGVIFLPREAEGPPVRDSLQRWRRATLFAIAAAVIAVGFTPVMRWLNLDRAEPVHGVSTSSG